MTVFRQSIVFGVSALSLSALAVQSARAGETVVVTGATHIETGGVIAPPPPTVRRTRTLLRPRVVRMQPAADANVALSIPPIDWLADFVQTLIGDAPAVRQRPRRLTARVAPPSGAAGLTTASLNMDGAVPAVGTSATPPSSATEKSPIVTGALQTPRPDDSEIHPEDRQAMILMEAERGQARADLVKLELARRTYDETRLSGNLVFDHRKDWRVLERAREALTPPEQAAARSAGFEANAYINETDKVIVVAVAGSQDLKRDYIAADIWRALIQAQAPQHFYEAKSYIRSVIGRYQLQGYSTQCVGHSLGGGACAYAASELGIRAVVVNPISAGRLAETARPLITNYVVDGDIANLVYGARGNELTGDVTRISDGRAEARRRLTEKYGPLAGAVLVVRDLQSSIKVHSVDNALDLIAAYAGTQRVR